MINEEIIFVLIIAVLKNNFPEIYLIISYFFQILIILILSIFIIGFLLYKIKVIGDMVDNYMFNLVDRVVNFENYMDN